MRINFVIFKRRPRPECETCGRKRTFLTRWEDMGTGRVFWRCTPHAPGTRNDSIVATAIRGGK